MSRRLERIGAVALKNTVYALPSGEDTLEDFQWLCGEIEAGGGETSLSVAVFIDDETDERLERAFREARGADYQTIIQAAEDVMDELRHDGGEGAPGRGRSRVNKLRDQLTSVRSIDFFDAPEGRAAEDAVDALEATLDAAAPEPGVLPAPRVVEEGRTWVTREGVKVDRIASAWLIRRFIDTRATFKFVPARGYRAGERELRFDMFDGEFTHVGDACTFETLLGHFELRDPALAAIAEIVHDIDIKDDRYGRPETAGVASLVRGITGAWSDDGERLRRGSDALDGLYESFRSPG